MSAYPNDNAFFGDSDGNSEKIAECLEKIHGNLASCKTMLFEQGNAQPGLLGIFLNTNRSEKQQASSMLLHGLLTLIEINKEVTPERLSFMINQIGMPLSTCPGSLTKKTKKTLQYCLDIAETTLTQTQTQDVAIKPIKR